METLYQIAVVISLAAIITGIYKGFGDNRTIVVLRNYNDLDLTFLVSGTFFLYWISMTNNGARGRIRTGDLPLRRRLLYPTELQAHEWARILTSRALVVSFKGGTNWPIQGR